MRYSFFFHHNTNVYQTKPTDWSDMFLVVFDSGCYYTLNTLELKYLGLIEDEQSCEYENVVIVLILSNSQTVLLSCANFQLIYKFQSKRLSHFHFDNNLFIVSNTSREVKMSTICNAQILHLQNVRKILDTHRNGNFPLRCAPSAEVH